MTMEYEHANVANHFAEPFCGAILGAAIGDAMGHPTEFMSMWQIREKFGEDGVKGYELRWQTDKGVSYAPYTDDTQMAEIVLRTLIDARSCNWDLHPTMLLMAERFIEWSNNPQGGHRAPGKACLEGCRMLEEGIEWSKAGHRDAGGCGSVMRSFPYGLAFHDDLERAEFWAVEGSKPTHRHPIALAASAAMAVGTALAVHHEPVEKIIDEMVKVAAKYDVHTSQMISDAYADAVYGVEPEETLQDTLQGWAAHEAIAAAVYVFVRHHDDPRAAILEGANANGDSDSIASIAGALVGAWNGLRNLPAQWILELERYEQLVQHGLDIATVKYWETDGRKD
jgi:ADP-ribosylglycohydrolase